MVAILLAQIAYALVGIGYNLVSISLRSRGLKPLNDGPTGSAIAVLLAYSLILFMPDPIYRIGMAVALVIIGIPGILAHIRRGPSSFYRSRSAWAWAIGINSSGAVLNVLGIAFGTAIGH